MSDRKAERRGEGVLLTGVYGSGKSSVAAEIAYLLEQQGEPYALLDPGLPELGRARHR
jgi:adenylylsulfate kinase-like enzyme